MSGWYRRRTRRRSGVANTGCRSRSGCWSPSEAWRLSQVCSRAASSHVFLKKYISFDARRALPNGFNTPARHELFAALPAFAPPAHRQLFGGEHEHVFGFGRFDPAAWAPGAVCTAGRDADTGLAHSGNQLLLTPANWCPMFAYSRAGAVPGVFLRTQLLWAGPWVVVRWSRWRHCHLLTVSTTL